MRRTTILILFVMLSFASKCFSQGILVTDSTGKILGGDGSDWSFDRENYEKNVLGKVYFRPVNLVSTESPEVPLLKFELNLQGLLIKWFIQDISNIKEFFLERSLASPDSVYNDWVSIGYLKAQNTGSNTDFEIIDRDVEEYKFYCYRLKVEYNNDLPEEHSTSFSFVYVYPSMNSELYPVYPNPVSKEFIVRFYLNQKDVVSINFVKGNKRFNIMKKETKDQGFYEIELSKEKFPFSNETVKLYMECESCGDGYQGDVEFK